MGYSDIFQSSTVFSSCWSIKRFSFVALPWEEKKKWLTCKLPSHRPLQLPSLHHSAGSPSGAAPTGVCAQLCWVAPVFLLHLRQFALWSHFSAWHSFWVVAVLLVAKTQWQLLSFLCGRTLDDGPCSWSVWLPKRCSLNRLSHLHCPILEFLSESIGPFIGGVVSEFNWSSVSLVCSLTLCLPYSILKTLASYQGLKSKSESVPCSFSLLFYLPCAPLESVWIFISAKDAGIS